MATSRRPKAKPEVRYRLRIELAEITPLIWREVWVEGHLHLLQLHHIIQAAMGWTDAHLHDFTIGGVRYAVPHEEDPEDLPQVDERTIRLDRILEPGLTFEYQYDFGDSWIHIVRVEQSKKMEHPYGAAFVQAGARAGPPEDAGGSSGYQAFLDRGHLLRSGSEVKY
ncbi:MAG: plasmid pRiA4b ORF-3 family protein, partial [Bryobacteraceae bacterium]